MLKDLHHYPRMLTWCSFHSLSYKYAIVFITSLCPLGLFTIKKKKNKATFVFSFHFITKTNITYQSVIRSSTIPILKPEAVTGNLPDGLVTVWCSLSGQKEVLVEEAQFVPFELDCPTSYNKQSGLALGCLLCQWKNRFIYNFPISDYVHSLIPNTQYAHIYLIKCVYQNYNFNGFASLTMNWLTINRLNLEFARWQRLKKLSQGFLSWNSISIPHQRGLVQVKSGQVLRQRKQ